MKVVALGLRGIPDVQGGVETHVQHLYPCLAQRGCSATVLARRGYARRATFQGVDVVPLYAPRRAGVEALAHSLISVPGPRGSGLTSCMCMPSGPGWWFPLPGCLV